MVSDYSVPRLPATTNRLRGHILQQQGSGDWTLLLPAFYAWIFAYHHPALVNTAAVDETTSATGQRRWLWNRLEDSEVAAIDSLLEALHRLVIIDPTALGKEPIEDGLDLAAALDFNYHSNHRRTGLGQLEYRAKYQESPDARAVLCKQMAQNLPLLPRRNPQAHVSICGVPARKRRMFHLATALATGIAAILNESNLLPTPLMPVEITISARKSETKSLSMTDKHKLWTRLLESDAMTLSLPVRGHTVYLVDDLYQSGTTLRSVARFLKSQGAVEVIGLAAVKSLSDTDNL